MTSSQDLVPHRGSSLGELAATVRSEHVLVLESAQSALLHARFAGEALVAAKDLVPRGEWVEWLLASFDFKLSTAYNYMRVANRWDEITAHGYAGLSDAIRGIRQWRGAGQVGRPGQHKYGESVYAEIRDLHAAGWSYTRVSKELGVSWHVVERAVDPDRARERERERNARARERRRAVKDLRRRELAKRAGGDIGAAFAGTLKLAETLAAAASVESDPSSKAALNSALLRLYGVEDLIVKALGTTHTSEVG